MGAGIGNAEAFRRPCCKFDTHLSGMKSSMAGSSRVIRVGIGSAAAISRASCVEIFPQRRTRVSPLRQPAPLQLRHDVLDEIVDVALGRKAAGEDEAAVRAGAEVQLIE